MVYLLVDSSGFGGIESHIQQLALLIQQHNVSVEVIFICHYPTHPQYSLLQQHQIPVRFLSDGQPWSFFSKLARCDVVHAHGYKASLLARMCRVLASYHLVTTFHAGEAVTGKLACYEWFNRYTSFLSRNLAVGQRIQQSIPFHCELLRNFILTNPQPNQRHRHDLLQVGFVGRLSYEKGIDRFAKLSRHNKKHCQFHVFGDGELSSMISDVPVINWHGSVNSMAEYWSHIDLLVISSRAEGLPMVALEAMANGVPVIATNVGDLASLLPENCLVEESQWQQLSVLIEQLSQADKRDWAQLSQHSHDRVMSQFSAESRWPQLAEVYQLSQGYA